MSQHQYSDLGEKETDIQLYDVPLSFTLSLCLTLSLSLHNSMFLSQSVSLGLPLSLFISLTFLCYCLPLFLSLFVSLGLSLSLSFSLSLQTVSSLITLFIYLPPSDYFPTSSLFSHFLYFHFQSDEDAFSEFIVKYNLPFLLTKA